MPFLLVNVDRFSRLTSSGRLNDNVALLPLKPPATHPLRPVVASASSSHASGPALARSDKSEVDQLYDNAIAQLGTFVANASSSLDKCASWEEFVCQSHGPPHLQPDLSQIDHPASAFLASLHDHGVPVHFDDPDWTLDQLDKAVSQGCNRSAEVHKEFIAQEMLEFAQDGFWTILPYSKVRGLPGLRLSPAQIKEERDRKPRFISDHRSWGVNDHSIQLAPKECMQFGGALYRLLYKIRHADPAHGPVYMAKFDIKDGFYRLHLRPSHCPRLAIVLPRYEGLPPLIAIPLAITMGWTNSPPTFCTLTETAADVCNDQLYKRHAPPHRLESLATSHDNLNSSLPRN